MNSNWLNKIQTHTETPPEGAWKNITTLLDKETENKTADFVTKLQAYHTAPPPNTLEKIFNRLDNKDEKKSAAFAERLYNYSATPPENAWEKITATLDNVAKIVSFKSAKNVLKPVYLRAVAAACLILIATAIWITSQKKSAISEKQTALVTLPTRQPQTTGAEKIILPAFETQEKKNTSLISTNQPAKKTVPLPTSAPVITIPEYVTANKTEELAQNPGAGNKEKLQNSNGETPMDISLMNTPNSYISITGPDGQTVKVSSKFSNLLNYLNDKDPAIQENLDIIIKESAKWRTTFAKWRNNMSNNTVAPSLSNFMDIFELTTILEEKDKK
jgi:hypothetical protein